MQAYTITHRMLLLMNMKTRRLCNFTAQLFSTVISQSSKLLHR